MRILAYTLLLLPLICTVALPAGDSPIHFLRWVQSLKLDPRATDVLDRFSYNGERLSEHYRKSLPARVRALMMLSVESQVCNLAKGNCEPFIDVTYPKPGFALQAEGFIQSDVERRFEEGFLRIEVVACFPGKKISTKKALGIYTSPEFRMEASSAIKRLWSMPGLSCVETKAIPALLPPTYFCNHTQEFHSNSLSAQHSQLVLNGNPDSYEPVYFKESIKTFVETHRGLALHYVNYTRSARPGKVKRYLQEKAVVHSQKSTLNLLRKKFEKGVGIELGRPFP